MGFAPTRKAARQLVSHGHILLNGKKCDIPSTIVGLKQTIEVKEKSKKLPVVNSNEVIKPLPFVEVSADKKGTYIRYPQRPELNLDINETYVVE